MDRSIELDIERLTQWATHRLSEGVELPWVQYRLMQLLDALSHLEEGPLSVSHWLDLPSPLAPDHADGATIVQLDDARHDRGA